MHLWVEAPHRIVGRVLTPRTSQSQCSDDMMVQRVCDGIPLNQDHSRHTVICPLLACVKSTKPLILAASSLMRAERCKPNKTCIIISLENMRETTLLTQRHRKIAVLGPRSLRCLSWLLNRNKHKRIWWWWFCDKGLILLDGLSREVWVQLCSYNAMKVRVRCRENALRRPKCPVDAGMLGIRRPLPIYSPE